MNSDAMVHGACSCGQTVRSINNIDIRRFLTAAQALVKSIVHTKSVPGPAKHTQLLPTCSYAAAAAVEWPHTVYVTYFQQSNLLGGGKGG